MLKILDISDNYLKVEFNGVEYTSQTRGSGCCRKVYIFDEFVVKFSGTDFYAQNKHESAFYKAFLDKKDSEYFAKLLHEQEIEGHGLVLVQEYVEDEPKVASKLAIEIFEGITQKYNLVDVKATELHRRNCALSQGRIKFYDLGTAYNSHFV